MGDRRSSSEGWSEAGCKRASNESGLTFAYSALFLVEGTGLFFEKRWAEYLTIVATVSFIPVEIYELLKLPLS